MTTKTDQAAANPDDYDDDNHLSHDNDEPPSPDGDDNGQNDGTKSLPMQKRRRVTRACDTCRGKKIKCDGKQPCTHCTVYSYGQSLRPPSASINNTTDTDCAQIVLTTNPRTGGGTQPLNISKPSRTVSLAPRLYSRQSCHRLT